MCVRYGWYQKPGREFEKGNMGVFRIWEGFLSASHNTQSLMHQILMFTSTTSRPAQPHTPRQHTQAREPLPVQDAVSCFHILLILRTIIVQFMCVCVCLCVCI